MGKRGPLPRDMSAASPSRVLPLPADGACADPPSFLNAKAQSVWRTIVPALMRYGIVDLVLDRAVLACFCTSLVRARELAQKVDEEGHVLVGPRGRQYRHPLAAAARQWSRDAWTLGDKLGLTPRSRLRMNIKPRASADLDEILHRAVEVAS